MLRAGHPHGQLSSDEFRGIPLTQGPSALKPLTFPVGGGGIKSAEGGRFGHGPTTAPGHVEYGQGALEGKRGACWGWTHIRGNMCMDPASAVLGLTFVVLSCLALGLTVSVARCLECRLECLPARLEGARAPRGAWPDKIPANA